MGRRKRDSGPGNVGSPSFWGKLLTQQKIGAKNGRPRSHAVSYYTNSQLYRDVILTSPYDRQFYQRVANFFLAT